MLQIGTKAPNFKLKATPDQYVELSDFKSGPTILVFYPADWSPVCGDQLSLYNECLEEFHRFDANLVAISVDGIWCHLAFAKDRKFRFPLLSDFMPRGDTAKAYGIYREEEGESERAIFLIDEQGIIQWSYLSPIGVNPGADGILVALEKLYPNKAA